MGTPVVITRDDQAEAHRLSQEIQAALIEGERHFLKAGRGFCKMQDQQLYFALGYDRFEDWVASPDVRLKLSHVWRLMRQARRTAKLAQRARREPALLATVAEEAGVSVQEGTVTSLAERAVLSMGIANADRVLGRALAAEDTDIAAEWIERGRHLTELDVEREVRRAKRGGGDDPVADFLIGASKRGIALFAKLGEASEDDVMGQLDSILALHGEIMEWLVREVWSGRHEQADPRE